MFGLVGKKGRGHTYCEKRYDPVWRVPPHHKPEEGIEEYFDYTGKLIGAVRSFGDIWQALKFLNADNTKIEANFGTLGLYYSVEQAKAVIESQVRI